MKEPRFSNYFIEKRGSFTILIDAFVYKELTWKKFWGALKTAVMDTAAVMLLITMSGPFSYAVTYIKLPQALAELILGITDQPQLLVIIILAWLFVLGMFLDSNVNFLLLTPIFLPMVKQVGIDPVHFGVLMATIVTLGVFTPPSVRPSTPYAPSSSVRWMNTPKRLCRSSWRSSWKWCCSYSCPISSCSSRT